MFKETWCPFGKNPFATYNLPPSLIPVIPEEIPLGRSEAVRSWAVPWLQVQSHSILHDLRVTTPEECTKLVQDSLCQLSSTRGIHTNREGF